MMVFRVSMLCGGSTTTIQIPAVVTGWEGGICSCDVFFLFSTLSIYN